MGNILMCVTTGDFKFDYLAKVVPAEFLYYKIIIFPFVINKYLEEDSILLQYTEHTSVILWVVSYFWWGISSEGWEMPREHLYPPGY